MTQTIGIQRHKAVVERFDALVRAGDPNDLGTLCTPDRVNHARAPGRPPSFAAWIPQSVRTRPTRRSCIASCTGGSLNGGRSGTTSA